MQTVLQILETKFRQAFTKSGIATEFPIVLVEASRPEFGDFQVNGTMAAAKSLKLSPRELASRIIENVSLDNIVSELQIAGPGFINIKLDKQFLADFLTNLTSENKFGAIVDKKETIVVDLSSPNLAKEMHVGHLRSTVIGDSLARVFTYVGHNVIRQNHVGDWGTQFGMLIAYMQEKINSNVDNVTHELEQFAIPDLEQFYREAKIKFDSSQDFANKARECVVKLQSGDKMALEYWSLFTTESQKHCDSVYKQLNVPIGSTVIGGYYLKDGKPCAVSSQCGESFYNAGLAEIVSHLEKLGMVTVSNGAKCIFFANGELPGSEETPFIVQKQDGGYLYATTDLAAIKYRVNTLRAKKIVYVVDSRQSFHFKQLFLVGKRAGFASHDTVLQHSAFGTMMNEDGRPFKTRDGGTIKLASLIDEAITKASLMLKERNPDWGTKEIEDLAEILAIGAIKYADLSKNRVSDYVFSLDKMLAFDGNTAPYLLYAYTRIQSILRKAKDANLALGAIIINEVTEHRLALHISRFSYIIHITAEECYPHYLCAYLYELSGLFMRFYENCPILKADTKMQQSRLALSAMAADILHDGLSILGIQTVDRM